MKNKVINKLFNLVLLIVLIIVFAIRILCYQEQIGNYIGLFSSPLASKTLTVICLLCIWFEYACVNITILNNWFKIKSIQFMNKFICPIVYLLNIILINQITILLAGDKTVVLKIFLLFETIIGFILSIYNVLANKEKYSAKDIIKSLGLFFIMLAPALPAYFFQFVFGYGKDTIFVKSISPIHRLYIYISIIIPFVLYFWLRNKKLEERKFALIYISLTTMVGFMVNYNYTTIFKPWAWPFHLCNTAMFIVPICLVFNRKKLFYFTYFINVLGAMLAMLMPNYDTSTNILSIRMFSFWFNHWIAFFMPLLVVALKVFKRPTLKEFKYSMIGFLVYYVIALVFNVVFSAYGHNVDYFFINSNFVADKLGKWAEDIFNISFSLVINDKTFVLHPLYQIAFFFTYVLLGLGMWFIYGEFFRIADSHYELHMKLHNMKIHNYANMSILEHSRKEKEMNEPREAVLEICHLTKKYASSKVYAVNDASFSVHGGEIFGFLGPNGAGKSTIIKSIVGIQTITSGTINVCGYDEQNDPVAAKYNIGYVPDHYALYEKLTGREYINYIAEIYYVSEQDRNERIEKYINLFELQNSIDCKIKTYSHGMKQKITIMAALVHNPKVWILDEPLTGLDPNSIYQVKECMKQHAKAGNIVFFSSHIIDIVEKICERIAIIKHGQIQCVKTIEEIEASGVTLEDFYMNIINNEDEMQ